MSYNSVTLTQYI